MEHTRQMDKTHCFQETKNGPKTKNPQKYILGATLTILDPNTILLVRKVSGIHQGVESQGQLSKLGSHHQTKLWLKGRNCRNLFGFTHVLHL